MASWEGGGRLEQALEGKGQKWLADQIGITPAAVSRYVSGSRAPDTTTLTRICQVLGVSADWLLGLADSPDYPELPPLDQERVQELRDVHLEVAYQRLVETGEEILDTALRLRSLMVNQPALPEELEQAADVEATRRYLEVVRQEIEEKLPPAARKGGASSRKGGLG